MNVKQALFGTFNACAAFVGSAGVGISALGTIYAENTPASSFALAFGVSAGLLALGYSRIVGSGKIMKAVRDALNPANHMV